MSVPLWVVLPLPAVTPVHIMRIIRILRRVHTVCLIIIHLGRVHHHHLLLDLSLLDKAADHLLRRDGVLRLVGRRLRPVGEDLLLLLPHIFISP